MTDAERLLRVIDEAVERIIEPFDVVAIAYSGGLDSSVLAALAGRHKPISCYCACVPSSHDEKEVVTRASEDGLEVNLLTMTDPDVAHLARLAKEFLPNPDPVSVSYTIPSLCALERMRERALIVGNVSDELFAGYAKYELSEDVRDRMDVDLKKALNELNYLRTYAQKNHKHLLAPYADERVRTVASETPIDRKLGPNGRKLILRECASLLGLGAADRPKKAAQYSSGVYKRLHAMARKEGKRVGEWVRDL